jgi:hypothetical protein
MESLPRRNEQIIRAAGVVAGTIATSRNVPMVGKTAQSP